MSVRDLRKLQITGHVHPIQAHGYSATENRQDVGNVLKFLGETVARCETQQAAYMAPEAAVVALGEAEIQRWRELVLANEPRRAWMARHGSLTPAWLGVLYDRAVLGVVAVGGPDGGTVEIPVAEYWERERTLAGDGVVAALGMLLIDLPGGPASIVFDEMVRRLQERPQS